MVGYKNRYARVVLAIAKPKICDLVIFLYQGTYSYLYVHMAFFSFYGGEAAHSLSTKVRTIGRGQGMRRDIYKVVGINIPSFVTL